MPVLLSPKSKRTEYEPVMQISKKRFRERYAIYIDKFSIIITQFINNAQVLLQNVIDYKKSVMS